MLWFAWIQNALALNDGGLQLWLSDSIDISQYIVYHYQYCYYRNSVDAFLMDLIHYSFAPLILFLVPYTLDLLP